MLISLQLFKLLITIRLEPFVVNPVVLLLTNQGGLVQVANCRPVISETFFLYLLVFISYFLDESDDSVECKYAKGIQHAMLG